jgi:hypothetical protein
MGSLSNIVSQKKIVSLNRASDGLKDLDEFVIVAKKITYVKKVNYQQFLQAIKVLVQSGITLGFVLPTQ